MKFRLSVKENLTLATPKALCVSVQIKKKPYQNDTAYLIYDREYYKLLTCFTIDDFRLDAFFL